MQALAHRFHEQHHGRTRIPAFPITEYAVEQWGQHADRDLLWLQMTEPQATRRVFHKLPPQEVSERWQPLADDRVAIGGIDERPKPAPRGSQGVLPLKARLRVRS